MLRGERLIFKQLSLALVPGRLTLIAGPNGAGKSTLLAVMAGLTKPSAGELTHDLEPGELALLGHSVCAYPGLTGLENLAFSASLHGLPKAETDLMPHLERLGLARAAHLKAAHYSRGMAQRLNLARVLLIAPKVLLLDEPATGLDQESTALLKREIRAAKERGTALAMVSHDLAPERLAAPNCDIHLADEVLYIEQGLAAYQGEPQGFAAFLAEETPGAAVC